MSRIAGISTETNAKGMVTKITIDLKKHPQAKAPLVELGLMEEDVFQTMVKNRNYVSFEEGREHLLNTVRDLWKK
ncbi:MAG: hypothetical protein EAZ53_07550 [Bacteroidetes bacterium]|nr:MAG: hypothetical protein EAZ53_07550 [Bacteroidota bacterium]